MICLSFNICILVLRLKAENIIKFETILASKAENENFQSKFENKEDGFNKKVEEIA